MIVINIDYKKFANDENYFKEKIKEISKIFKEVVIKKGDTLKIVLRKYRGFRNENLLLSRRTFVYFLERTNKLNTYLLEELGLSEYYKLTYRGNQPLQYPSKKYAVNHILLEQIYENILRELEKNK